MRQESSENNKKGHKKTYDYGIFHSLNGDRNNFYIVDLSKYAEQLEELIDSSQGYREDVLNSLPKKLSVSKEDAIKALNKAFVDEEIVLVLGAGVSMQFGLPNWNELLQNVMLTTIKEDTEKAPILAKLFTLAFNPNSLIAGRYLQNHYKHLDKSFDEVVRDVIYKSIDRNKKSELMNEIVSLCVSPGRTPNIDSIITYNFDDILEAKLESMEVPPTFKPVYKIGTHIKNQLPIYHVHGFLPQHGELEKENQITFGEAVYHQQYSDTYSWNNIIQINKFREKTCVFIGTSLTDPNVRRLLDIAKKQKGDESKVHYIFKHKYDLDSLKKQLNHSSTEEDLKKMGLDETASSLVEIIERFEEADTDSFGVKTIWVDSWSEVPDILKQMREKAIKEV